MVIFRSQYDDDLPRFKSQVGSRIHQTYVGAYDDDGVLQLIPDKVINIYDQIQSHRDSCDLAVLLRRYLNGDSEALNRVQGVYGDFSTVPSNYADVFNRVADGQRVFNGLNADVKSVFGNSYEQFLVAISRGDFWNRVSEAGILPESSNSIVEKSEVKTDE